MPPAFNLSQDQTLQFISKNLKFDLGISEQLAFFIDALVTRFKWVESIRLTHRREHPHKTPDQIVKQQAWKTPQADGPFYGFW